MCFLTRSHLDSSPYAEIALPSLAEDGWDITVKAPGASNSVLWAVRRYPRVAADMRWQDGRHVVRQEAELLRALWSARWGGYDVIYVNSQSLSARAALALAGPKLGKRLVYHNPDYYDPFSHPRYFRLERRFCRKVDLYLNNEFHRGYITQALYGIACPVVTAPPNLPACWPIPRPSAQKRAEMCGGSQSGQFVIMLHGGYNEIRMVPELFRALALAPPHIRLVMTGREHRRAEVDRSLASLGIEGRVHRLPRVSFQEMLAYTVNADAGVLLYQNNDIGNFFTAPGRLTEYLACGSPVLASNHTGLENLVLRYGLGETVLSTDPKDIAAGILRLERAVREGRLCRGKMRDLFLRHFAFDHWEPTVVMAFNELLEGRGRRATEPPRFPWMPTP